MRVGRCVHHQTPTVCKGKGTDLDDPIPRCNSDGCWCKGVGLIVAAAPRPVMTGAGVPLGDPSVTRRRSLESTPSSRVAIGVAKVLRNPSQGQMCRRRKKEDHVTDGVSISRITHLRQPTPISYYESPLSRLGIVETEAFICGNPRKRRGIGWARRSGRSRDRSTNCACVSCLFAWSGTLRYARKTSSC